MGSKAKHASFHRWDTCSLCEQNYHGVVACALGWACWKTYLERPELDWRRVFAMNLLENGLGEGGRHAERLVILEASWATEKRRGTASKPEELFTIQGNIANCYVALGRKSDALRVRREIMATRHQINSPKNPMFIRDVENLAISLGTSQLYAEARSLLREYLPMAVRVLGRDHELTFGMTETLANAISENGAAPREGLLESMNMLTENSQRLRRVLGASHPATKRNAHNLKCVQGSLARLE